MFLDEQIILNILTHQYGLAVLELLLLLLVTRLLV